MYAGSDWVAAKMQQMSKPPMSAIGQSVADMLGLAFRGIYHISRAVHRTDWSTKSYIEMTLEDGDFATFDGESLTWLVILAHEMAIRVQISAARNGLLRLTFSRRKREGSIMERHPSIEEAVEKVRKSLEPYEVK